MKIFRKVWNIVSVLIIILLIFLAAALGGARLFGFQVYSVLSGSMEPAYHVGSLIYVRSTEPEDVEIGDPITFVANEDLVVVTHRVVDISVDEDGVIRYQTKGDANDAPDGSWVHQANLLGEPKFSIPKLGYLSDFISHPPGRYLAVAAAAVLILLIFLPELVKALTAKEDEDSKAVTPKGRGGRRRTDKNE